MGSSQRFNITLPDDMVDVVQRKVTSGAYASVSEVVREGVRALVEQDAALEFWLREEVLIGHAEYEADPSSAIPAERVLAEIKVRYSAASK